MSVRRICVLRHNYFPEEAHLARNVEALVAAGFQVDVVCLREPGASARESYKGGDIYRLPLLHRRGGPLRYLFEYAGFFFLAFLLLAWRSLRRPYHTVEVYNLPDFLMFAALPARLRGSRVVLYLFEMMPEQLCNQHGTPFRQPLARLLRWVERISVRFADRVVTVSPHQKLAVMARCHPGAEPEVVANVPDERLFFPRPRAEGPFRLLTHGSLLPRYGIDVLVRAVPRISEEIPNLEVWITGQGEDKPRLERLARKLGVERVVRFFPWAPLEQLPQHIAQVDIGIVTTPAPWLLPNKLFDYVAMGKPVVASDNEAIRAVFADTDVAYFQPGESGDLARRVLELHADPDLACGLAENASRAYQPYRWQTASQRYAAMHSELAGHSDSGRDNCQKVETCESRR